MLRLALLTTLGLAVFRSPDPAPRAPMWCVLAIPPSQVARTPHAEPVYCLAMKAGQCTTSVGWITITDPVECD